MMLVLFDVDKTLFLTSDPLMGQATTDAVEAVWGLSLAGDAIKGVDHQGQTAKRITREILRLEGLDDDAIDAVIDRWCEVVSDRYLDLLATADTSGWRAPEGTDDALRQIPNRALLTGNPEPVARARMERIGLAEFFPPGQGAFGCEAEDRAELIAIARGRGRRSRCDHRAHGGVARSARAAQRRDLSARSIWRSASRFAISRRLSRCSFPRARAISTFARPSLK